MFPLHPYSCRRFIAASVIAFAGLMICPHTAQAQQVFMHQTFCSPQVPNNGTSVLTIVAQTAGMWQATISGPGMSPITKTFTNSLAWTNIILPVYDAEYTETLTYLGTPSWSYTTKINSAYAPTIGSNTSYNQQGQKNNITLSFGVGYPPGGTTFPYTVGIRVSGTTNPLTTHTFYGANGDGTFNKNFGSLLLNTTYEWVIVPGTTINPADPATAAFLNTHHVSTTGI